MSYIYIFTNKSFPGHVKVGMTTKSPSQRAAELHTTGVPTPFVVYAVWSVPATALKSYEQKAHHALKQYRVQKNREFFKIDAGKAKSILAAVIPTQEQIEEEAARAKIELDKQTAELSRSLRSGIDEYRNKRNNLMVKYKEFKTLLSGPDLKIVRMKYAACSVVEMMGAIVGFLLFLAVFVSLFWFISRIDKSDAGSSFIFFISLTIASVTFARLCAWIQERLDIYQARLPMTHRMLNQRLVAIANEVKQLDQAIETDISKLNEVGRAPQGSRNYTGGGGMSYRNVYSKRPSK